MTGRPHPIPITRPVLGDEEHRAVGEVIASGWVAQGARVKQFEHAVGRHVGADHAVAVSSGTAALHLALVAHGVGPGDAVVVPALSFIASANVVRHAGARPLFADVDPRTFNVTAATVARALSSDTRAILAVHQLGLAADLEPLVELTRERGLLLLQDAACALGAEYRGARVGGGYGTCCFSFHPRKIITTGEGGMITTNDEALADRLRCLRNQGLGADAYTRHGAIVTRPLRYSELGYNYRLTDLQAAVGLAQMDRLDGLVARRRELAARYDAQLAAVDGVTAVAEPAWARHAYQSYMILLDDGSRRDEVMTRMHADGITTGRAVTAIHLEPLYGGAPGTAPVAEDVAQRGLILPLYPDLTERQLDRVVSSLADALD